VSNLFQLDGKRILITGSSGEIGRACAVVASGMGACLVLQGRDEGRLEATLKACAGGNHAVERFDLEQTSGIAAWVKDVAGKHGSLSGVVHAAGIQIPRTLRYLTVQEYETVQRVNCTTGLFLAQGARQKGVCLPGTSIVFISSVLGLVGQPLQSSYAASKGALIAMARALALEMAREGFRVNCVAPGLIESPMSERLRTSMAGESFSKVREMHPLGFGTAEDVAHSVTFLLSPAARWITGSTLAVDGGYTAH
jgi:NAD(P)-dependent dehydrogenase (short-subunit alcohol dehydrogenase family)